MDNYSKIGYPETDEISIRELIETILDGRKTIAIFLAAAVLVTGLGSLIFRASTREARAVVSLNFEGIEKGLNPDNTKFETGDFKTPQIILQAIRNMELDEKSLSIDEIRKGIEVEPIVPANVVEIAKKQREQGKDYMYFPNEYIITLKSSAVKNVPTAAFLSEIVNSYSDDFTYKYSKEAALGNTVKNFEYTEYDYPDISRMFSNQISLMKSYLAQRVQEAPDFRSPSTGLSFEDIRKSVDLIDSIDVNRMDSLINAYMLTKDKGKLIVNYEYRIKRTELEKEKSQSELAITADMMDRYKREQSSFLLPGFTGEMYSMDKPDDSSYYDTLVERATNAGVTARNKAHDIAYLSNEIELLMKSEVDPRVRENVEQDVIKLATDLSEKIDLWIGLIEETAYDYYNTKLTRAIVVLAPAEMHSDISIARNLAIGAVAGLMIGVFAVLFRKFWEDSDPAEK